MTLLQIVVNEPERLVLHNRSYLMGGMLGFGAGLSVFTVIGVAVWGAFNLTAQTPLPTYYWLRMLLLLIVFVMGCAFAWVVATTAMNLWRGTRCAFDRAAESVTVTRANGWRTEIHAHSIYGVSHALLEPNVELRSLALYLVLRSGQRIPLGTFSAFEQDAAERAVRNVKAFLRR